MKSTLQTIEKERRASFGVAQSSLPTLQINLEFARLERDSYCVICAGDLRQSGLARSY